MSELPSFLRGVTAIPRLDDLHAACLARCKPGGLHLEFGVAYGTSLRMLRHLIPTEQTIYGFDSFKGLPEPWHGNPVGAFATGARVTPPNVELVEGWFADTVPAFARAHADEHVSYMHIDCDLYSSTKTVLFGLKALIVPGTVIVFDEYFGYEGWQDHEHRAFAEFIESRRYEFIARDNHFRVGVRIAA